MDRVVNWVKDGPGPPETCGTICWFVGMMLWWRIWGVALLHIIPFFVGLYILQVLNGFYAVLGAVMLMSFANRWSMSINPKFEVKKNY